MKRTDTAIREAGLVHIFYGGSTGAQRSGAQGFDQDSPDVPSTSVARDFFWQTVVAGDFNDDGFADLVVAAPYQDLDGIGNVGTAIAFFGTVNGISAINSQLLQPTRIYPGALFGYVGTMDVVVIHDANDPLEMVLIQNQESAAHTKTA